MEYVNHCDVILWSISFLFQIQSLLLDKIASYVNTIYENPAKLAKLVSFQLI